MGNTTERNMREKKLPLARSTGNSNKPDDFAIFKIKQLVFGFVDSALYAKKRLAECFSRDRPNPESAQRLKDFDDFYESIKSSQTKQTMLFDGIYKEQTPFQALQYDVSKKSLSTLAQLEGYLQFDFAVSEDSNLVRAFTVDGVLADPKVSDDFDSLLNASLASGGMKHSDGGYVYLIDSKGQFLENGGEKVKADPKKIQHLFNSPAGDFQQRCASGGINVTVVQREPTPEQKKQAAASSDQSPPSR